MRSLLLGSLLALASYAVHAQNTITVTQSGTANVATPSQTGTNLSGTISQVSAANSNSAISFQTGTGHSFSITQNASAYNRAGVTQAGTSPGSNSATISQTGNTGATTRRSGTPSDTPLSTDANWGGIWQQGSSNQASLTQDGATTRGNFAETWQRGTGNRATTTQNGAFGGRAEIFQGDDTRNGQVLGYNSGANSNSVTVNQSNSQSNTAFVRQFSNSNSAFVQQAGANSQSNLASVVQGPDGSSNTARILQGNGSNSGVISNTAIIQQYGINGYASIDHDFFGRATSNQASIIQTTASSSNTALITQSSLANAQFNVGNIVQSGSNSFARIYDQNGSRYNQSSIEQGVGSSADRAYIRRNYSTSATAGITQNLTTNPGGASNNVASIVQGDPDISAVAVVSSTATIAQEGKNNSALLFQTGSGHQATVTQTGNNNIVQGPISSDNFPGPGGESLLTNATGNYAEQGGSNQTLTVTQTSSGGSSTFGNTLTASQLGNANIGTVTQLAGTGSNIGTLTQNGTGNIGMIMQTNGVVTP